MFEPLRVVQLHVGAVSTATDDHGTAVDLGPYINVGKRQAIGVSFFGVTGTDTDETYDNKLQESDGISGAATTVSSDWSDITDAAFTQVAHDGSVFSEAVATVRFLPNKRFLRNVITLGGTTATAEIACAVILQGRYST